MELLIDQGRYRLTVHAQRDHPEISDVEKVAVVRYGANDKPDSQRPPGAGVYLFWARHPVHGVCRAVYAIEAGAQPDQDILVLITAFPE